MWPCWTGGLVLPVLLRTTWCRGSSIYPFIHAPTLTCGLELRVKNKRVRSWIQAAEMWVWWVYRARPTGRRHQGRPRTCWRVHISQDPPGGAWKCCWGKGGLEYPSKPAGWSPAPLTSTKTFFKPFMSFDPPVEIHLNT